MFEMLMTPVGYVIVNLLVSESGEIMMCACNCGYFCELPDFLYVGGCILVYLGVCTV